MINTIIIIIITFTIQINTYISIIYFILASLFRTRKKKRRKTRLYSEIYKSNSNIRLCMCNRLGRKKELEIYERN
jgi:hypothetical protein